MIDEKNIPASIFLKELFRAKKCDQSIQKHLDEYQSYVGNKRMARILKDQANPIDEKKAFRAIHHYNSLTRSILIKNLKWSSWVYYKTIFRTEQFLEKHSKTINDLFL